MLVVLLIFLGLSVAHSVIVPITQGEDELAHYRYIKFIAQTGRLPINQAERQQAWYRADWPPLYHLLVGATVFPLDTSRPHLKDVGESPRRRLVGQIFYPRLIIYTEDTSWPWQDGILAWHIGRFISIGLAAGALVFTYLTALELGRDAEAQRRRGAEQEKGNSSRPPASLVPRLSPPLFATAVTALLAFTPRFLFTSAMLGDDSLFVLLSAVFIWLLLRALRGDDRLWVYVVLGLLLGLSIATKYSTGLLALTFIPLVWRRARQAGWRWTQALGRLVVGWLFTLVGASWWFGWIGYHFNTIKADGLFFGLLSPVLAAGPDVSMRRVFAFFGGGQFSGSLRPDAVSRGTFWEWWVYLFQTFWGVPVLEHDPLFPWAYLLVLFFCLLALFGLWHIWRAAGLRIRVTLGVLALVVALLFPFPILRFFLTYNILETGQGRHILYPAAQAIPILLMLGWWQVVRWQGRKVARSQGNRVVREQRRRGTEEQTSRVAGPQEVVSNTITHYAVRTAHYVPRSTFYVFLLPTLLLIWSTFQLIYMAKTYPDPLPVQTTTFNPATIPQPLKHNFSEAIRFLGYDYQPDSEQAIINLTLYWQAVEQPDENYRTRVQLIDPSGQSHFTWLSHPVNGLYPTRAWDAGDVIRDRLPLPMGGVPANTYQIQIDLLHQAKDIPLTAVPFQIIQFDLPARPPIPNASTLDNGVRYRLWVDDIPARHRQALPLSWSGNPAARWTLLGPDNAPRHPSVLGDATAIFVVEANWPSGKYRLALPDGSLLTGPKLTVANEVRLFELPPEVSTQRGWTPVEANFANQLELIGYVLPTRRVEPDGSLPLNLAWRSLAPVLPDAVTFAVLLDANQQPFGNVDRYPDGFYSPLLWVEGEVVLDSFSVPVRSDAPPGVYFLHLGQYQKVDGQSKSLPLYHRDSPTQATAVVIGPLRVGGPPPGVTTINPQPQVSLNQPLGAQVTLLGYDLTIQNSETGIQNLKLTLYWRADAFLATDYTTFFHLRDVSNQHVAQKDAPPAGGRYPTSLWDPGEIIVDEITLPLEQIPPGEYTPVVGLYDFVAGARLPVPGNPANELALEPIQIDESAHGQ